MKTIPFAWLLIAPAFVQPTSAANTTTYQEKVLHSFGSGTDGAGPGGRLLDVNGALYGTTQGGGNRERKLCSRSGCGTVFLLDPDTGAEKVLYAFCRRRKCADGASPDGDLIDANGTLYGATQGGGTGFFGQHFGTAFALDRDTGKETVLYSFCKQQNCPDGAYPSGVVDVNGLLYGTTSEGGTGAAYMNGGAVFSIDLNTDAETVLYSFCGQQQCTDGAEPHAGVIDANGVLYGTSFFGGELGGCTEHYPPGCGAVFSVDPSTGAETVLYAFGSLGTGWYPGAGLIAVDGMLYGTTSAGGHAGCPPFGCGVVFSVDPNTDVETVLYSFCSQQSCADGEDPSASLIDVNGKLYGTTQTGGAYGYGTVFSVDPNTGAEKVLYSFCSQQNCADGAYPTASLTAVKGKLYGTTGGGGAYGAGTVFVLTKNR